ncbi:hypothetical protein KC343_g4265 [Hortaea werneckii]|uniref:Cytochrome b561 domain-containing protein n=1 Tax=Hortaea werneckii TaxID=91943 RepID=A0A3M7HB24_HORWE|nr:hypothetical protein KC352_g11347 [Hortaea werneckii]KAI7566627.1 hypothetical protein KC317_g5542 [Hortaea werneckii]KAI7618936.1 hypothetical protein KC346_g4784 [Hortaea werneckii]KAI7631059.1 hypothetical protein KC343_g4265 [Hortaea werneckii]KAI7669959.1 hypothetical protein KC319_g6007 [Hortaea werneckii]
MSSNSILVAVTLAHFACMASARHVQRDADDESDGSDGGGGVDKTTAHGVIACIAWLIFLIGAVFMRALKGSKTWLVHACTQSIALVLVVASAALGIQLAQSGHQLDQAHVVIGLLLFAALWLLAIGGLLQHLYFRKYQQQSIIGVAHAWSARLMITLAIINGGLGLALAGGHEAGTYVAYGVVTAVIWISWVGFTIISIRRESRNSKGQ